MFLCGALLLLALTPLPIGYFTVLRIVVTVGAVWTIVQEFNSRGFDFWIISFGLIAAIFNPLIPVYLGDKEVWMPIDIVAATIFFLKGFALRTK